MERKTGLRATPPLQPVALCYIRQSFTRDPNDMNSPERQRANIQAVCDREGWTPVWFIDAEGHKSGRYESNRPEWLRLKQHLSDPGVIAVVANDLARLHRKAWRVGRLVDDELEPHHIRLVLAAPGRDLDTSTPVGRMVLMLYAMNDEAYSQDISVRTKDNIAYRKSQGKTIGMPPFGTVRGKEGYLIPTTEGVWLLPDGHYQAGKADDSPAPEGAIWHGYFECAKRILELYAEDAMGRDRIAYRIHQEGWVFRDRKGQPRPITKDDIRRVTSAWREYAGITSKGRGRDHNASLIENPTAVLYDTGRAVFDLKLLHRVATVEENRSETTRPRGSVQKAHPFALARLLYCAHCEREAVLRGNPKIRSRLSGHDARGQLRYRHAEGVTCGSTARSLPIEVIEREFRLLIEQLTLREESFAMLVEMAIQSEHGHMGNQDDLEREKTLAIAKCRRRIDAAKAVFLDGDMPREEYAKIKEDNERQIAHWQARTTETEKMGIELRMVMNFVNQILEVWDSSPDEDRQQMAHMLFETIVYDLDRRQITDFRLKAWADRYLVLRTELYGNAEETAISGENEDQRNAGLKESTEFCSIGSSTSQNGAELKDDTDFCSIGDSNPCFSLERATS